MADEVKTTETTESTETTASSETPTANENRINSMYDANLASKTSALESERDTQLSNMQASRDKIATSYDAKRNSIAAEYERQKRNNNLQAQANGLNTGAGSQMQLGQNSAYQSNQANLTKSQGEEEAEADRQMDTIRNQYAMQIQQAAADNDFNRMSALYDEGVRAEEQARNDAGVRASFGDFSGYVSIYGQDVANQMQKTWALQNPDTAYNLGYITADEYYKQTGKYPNGYSSGGGYSGGYYYGGSNIHSEEENEEEEKKGAGKGSISGYDPGVYYERTVNGKKQYVTYSDNGNSVVHLSVPENANVVKTGSVEYTGNNKRTTDAGAKQAAINSIRESIQKGVAKTNALNYKYNGISVVK